MIFDRDDRIDEVMNYEHDVVNVDLETTNTSEVYIFIAGIWCSSHVLNDLKIS